MERRETLVAYSDSAPKQEPRGGEQFDLEDVRKDEECADTVGVYLQVDDRAAPISDDARAGSANSHSGDDIDSLQGSRRLHPAGNSGSAERFCDPHCRRRVVRVRSQTIYYVLTRIKGICKVYLDRQRRAVA